jgi:hypothetical protein
MPGIVEPRRSRQNSIDRVNPDQGFAILLAASIGAGIMYLLAPARGRRRRRRIIDRMNRLAPRTGDAFGSTSRRSVHKLARTRRSSNGSDVIRAALFDDYQEYRNAPNGTSLP